MFFVTYFIRGKSEKKLIFDNELSNMKFFIPFKKLHKNLTNLLPFFYFLSYSFLFEIIEIINILNVMLLDLKVIF